MKKLIARMSLYSDGTYLWERNEDISPSEEPVISPSESEDPVASAQTRQILRVIEVTLGELSYQSEINSMIINNALISDVFTNTIKIVAEEFDVTTSSIYDKLNRKLGKKTRDWTERFIPDMVNGRFEEIQTILEKNAVKVADITLIKNKFDEFRNEIK